MLALAASVPSPLAQAAVYMAGLLTGYLMLTSPEEWQRARRALAEVWNRRRRD